MGFWRESAIGAWRDAKGTCDAALAERAPAGQGLDGFIDTLRQAGAL